MIQTTSAFAIWCTER